MILNLLLTALLIATTCNAMQGPSAHWERKQVAAMRSPSGTVLWVAPGDKGHEIISILALNTGGISVFAEPALTYQRARSCGAAFRPEIRVCTEVIEVVKNLPPEGAADTFGWRDPASVLYYPLQVFPGVQGSAFRVPNRETGIPDELRIFERGDSWLIVITTTGVVVNLDEVKLAGGEK